MEICVCVWFSVLPTARQLSPPLCNSISSCCCHCAAVGSHSNQPTFRWLPCSSLPYPRCKYSSPPEKKREEEERKTGLGKIFQLPLHLCISVQDEMSSRAVGFADRPSRAMFNCIGFAHLLNLQKYVNQFQVNQQMKLFQLPLGEWETEVMMLAQNVFALLQTTFKISCIIYI